MKPTEIAHCFSMGEFEKTYSFIADDITWHVVGEEVYKGKTNLVHHCTEVSQYFKSVETCFQINHIICQDNKVVVTGTAKFSNHGVQLAFVSASDLYEFNAQNLLIKITSYCIPST